ncbi:hypothetical protein ACEWY4_013505 [Coilia grayii]|uniref:Uncharacterized protein n=1 Tax=Coilia grayii TaxID=363190 RepID=A0ABD1JWH7_9TELE
MGSQFWPENSQALSQDLSLSSRTTKQNSEEGSEWRVSTNYHAKPYLFTGDTEMHSANNSKPATGMLDRFEEDKKRAKDKSESEMIHHEFLQLHESLEKTKQFLERVNTSGETTHKALVEGISDLTRTIKESMDSVWSSIGPKIETVITKLDSQNQTLREIEDREVKLATATKDLSSHLQDLQRNMDSLKVEHSQEQSVLVEMQSLLAATLEATTQRSAARPVHMVSSEVQTSPDLVERFCVVSEEKRVFQGLRLCGPGGAGLLDKPSEPTVGLSSSPMQTSIACDQRVPSRAALRPLPANQEKQVMNVAAGGMKESLWQQSVCTQVLEPSGDSDTVSGSALTKPQGRYALRQQISRRILGPMQDNSHIIAVTDSTQLWPATQEVMLCDFPVRKGYGNAKSKKRPRVKKRALIPSNAPSACRGAGRRSVSHRSRPDHDDKEEEEDELSPLYHFKNKAFRNTKPPQTLKENKQFDISFDGHERYLSAFGETDGNAEGQAMVQITETAKEGLWNLFSFNDSD